MKLIITPVSFLVLFFSITSFALAQSEEDKVKGVLSSYWKALEALNIDNTEQLFTENSAIFESGGVEGTYVHYVEHHLGPELKAFKSFELDDYTVDVNVDLPYAFATETYVYRIVLAEDEKLIEQKGVATSVLKKMDGQWKIHKMHTSARRIRK